MDFHEILAEVLRRETPTESRALEVEQAVQLVLTALKQVLNAESVKAEVEVEGSFTKGTWLPGDVDVDIFLLFDPEMPLEKLEEVGLRIAVKAAESLGANFRRMYASHPYLTLELPTCVVDVVPAYKVPSPSEIRSPVDRTPFHTRYVKARVERRPELKGEIRVAKRFMKGIEVYGAEIRVEGFSGYLVELLVIHFGSFISLLKAASTWKPYKVVIDPENHYSDPRQALKRFHEPLVVVDPVDPKRNVASPVSLECMSKFIAAARAFLRAPNLRFFYPAKRDQLPGLQELLRSRSIVALRIEIPELPEDVLWGQAKKALRALSHGLERYGFSVLASTAWSQGRELVLLFELEELVLPPIEKHYGPPVYSSHDARFLETYASSVAGPYIEGERWVVIRPRRVRCVEDALSKLLHSCNIGEHLTSSLKAGYRLFTGESVVEASSNEDFKIFLAEWLVRKPPWS